MKKLLSLVAMLALAAACVPHEATAGLRGSFDPITNGIGLPNGTQTPAIRPGFNGATGGLQSVERYLSFTSRSLIVGQETSREIYLCRNVDQIAARVADLADARQTLLKDPTGLVSYADPAWSADGRYLAYVQTDKSAITTALYVQEYELSTNLVTASTPVGAPILVVAAVPNVANRHPNWNPDGQTLAFDSNASGNSIDLYKVQVFDSMGNVAVGAPVKLTFVDNRAEQNPAWAPDGVRLAFDTNLFGPNVIEILDTSTMVTTLAETNFKTVSHSHPRWSSDGLSIYYDCPQNEDPAQNTDIWKLDLASQSKCDILFDGNGDVNVDVSRLVNHTRDGVEFNPYYFETNGGTLGLCIWRSNFVTSCVPALPMGIAVSPATLNLGSNGQDITFTMSFPAETKAAGFQCQSFNGPAEGVRMRRTIFPSPTFLGLRAKFNLALDASGVLPDYKDVVLGGEPGIVVHYDRRTIASRLVSLGLVNQLVPVQGRAYSNLNGRAFQGFAYLTLSTSSLAGSAVKLEQNSPNPFNPVTKIRFATSKSGNVALRIYNVRGELVKTLANRNFDAGSHEVTWDGKNSAGLQTSSGVYYAKVSAAGGSNDVIKMVMAK